MCFPTNFTKFLGAPFLENTFGRLLLSHALGERVWFRVVLKIAALDISKKSLKNRDGVLFKMAISLQDGTLLEKAYHWYFSRNFEKFFGAGLIQNICE